MKSMIITVTILLITAFLAYYFLSNTNQSMNQTINISPTEFWEKVQDKPGVVIDVRTDEEYNNGHLTITSHQYNLLDGEFENQLENLDKNETYYLYCRTGNRSGQAARLMKEKGFENVYNVGGFSDLSKAGFETK